MASVLGYTRVKLTVGTWLASEFEPSQIHILLTDDNPVFSYHQDATFHPIVTSLARSLPNSQSVASGSVKQRSQSRGKSWPLWTSCGRHSSCLRSLQTFVLIPPSYSSHQFRSVVGSPCIILHVGSNTHSFHREGRAVRSPSF